MFRKLILFFPFLTLSCIFSGSSKEDNTFSITEAAGMEQYVPNKSVLLKTGAAIKTSYTANFNS